VVELLIVEDNERFRDMLRSSLQSSFPLVQVSTAPDAAAALQMIGLRRPDLVFVDIRMPGKSGIVLTREIKKQDNGIVIVVLTNMDTKEYREAAFANGADFFLSKESVRAKEIHELVEGVIAKCETGREDTD
jgi:two-component system response regulator YesN